LFLEDELEKKKDEIAEATKKEKVSQEVDQAPAERSTSIYN